MTPAGFPHSDIPGSEPVCGSPRLFAAYHVLHRLSAPRHPPCTLSSLTKLECLTRDESYRLGPIQLSKILERRTKKLSRIAGIRASEHLGTAQPSGDPLTLTGGADRVRTDDLRLARAALSRLSYSPIAFPGSTTEGRHPVRSARSSWWA